MTVLAFLAAALAASTVSPVLEASVPWWERITVTVDDKGQQQSCHYEASLSPAGAGACSKALAASMESNDRGPSGQYSKVTFERRFSPGGQLDSGRLEPGDELLGRQVMFLTIAADGSIESCRVVASSGDLMFQYGCDEARKEQFRVPASLSSGASQAFMTILAYGHVEELA
jgi:hypothetical protein